MLLDSRKPARQATGVFLQDGLRLAPMKGWKAVIMHTLATKGRITAADLPPGTRLAAEIHRLKWKMGVRIHNDPTSNRNGIGSHAVYRPLGVLSVVEFDRGGRD